MKRIVIAMSLVLALILGCVAFAEATSTIPDQTVEETTVPTAPAEENNDQAALEEALKAYRAAKEEKYLSDLEEELAGYVAAGSLTQEQADLILNQYKTRAEQRANNAQGKGRNRGMKGSGKGRGMNGGYGMDRGCGMGGMNGMGGRMNGGYGMGRYMAETDPAMAQAPAVDEGI